MAKKLLPYILRRTSTQNQISLPKEYLKELGVGNIETTFKITLDKSKKKMNLELI